MVNNIVPCALISGACLSTDKINSHIAIYLIVCKDSFNFALKLLHCTRRTDYFSSATKPALGRSPR